MYTIGEFSKIGQVSAKMLRHYDKIGLLLPEEINESNGYRYYSQEQVKDIITIKKLKSYKFSLLEIKELLANDDPDAIKVAMEQKLIHMEQELNQYQLLMGQMKEEIQRLQEGTSMFIERSFDIYVEQLEEITYVSLRDQIDINEVGRLFSGVIGKVYEKSIQQVGPMMAKYYDEDFDVHHVDIEICIPVNKHIEGLTMVDRSQLCVSTEFKGPYSEISQGYAALLDYCKSHNLQIKRPTLEKYIVGPDSGLEAHDFVTTIHFPIHTK